MIPSTPTFPDDFPARPELCAFAAIQASPSPHLQRPPSVAEPDPPDRVSTTACPFAAFAMAIRDVRNTSIRDIRSLATNFRSKADLVPTSVDEATSQNRRKNNHIRVPIFILSGAPNFRTT